MLHLLKTLIGRRQTAAMRVPGGITEGSRVLAVGTRDLVDFLSHAPLLTGIRQRWPSAMIDLLLPEDLASVVVPSRLARQVLVYNEKQLGAWRPAYLSLLRGLSRGGYDAAIMMSLSPRPELEAAALASGAALRAGCGHRDAYPALNLELRAADPPAGYAVDLPRTLAPYLGLEARQLGRGWPLSPDRLKQTAQRVHFHKPSKDELLVGIDPGLAKAGHGFAIENLGFLARAVASQVNCRVLPLGMPSQSERVQRFEGQIGGAPPGLPRTTLLEILLALCQCDLFVAGNTELFHAAVAYGVPVLGLFTPDDAPHWRPGRTSSAHVLTVKRGEKVDLAVFMAAIENIIGGRGAPARSVAPTPVPAPEA